MDSGFQEKEEKQVKLLTVACRFVPYDQWLVTHVDSSWTITQVKSWILAKCIANNSIGSPPSPSPNLPPINPPTKPKTKPARRPASPIIFAEFSPVDGNPARAPGHNLDEPVKEEKPKRRKRRGRGRPISPITFAPIGNGDQGDESDYDPFKTQEAEGEVIGMGYEEDDEWESSEEGTDIDELELELDSKPRRGRRANRNQYLGFHDRPLADQQSPALPPSATSRALTKINPAAIPRGSFSTYHPRLLTVIRFSTGQILEKHYTVQDYELKPYELLEIHRLGVVAKLPREVTSKYIEPYWEGWVKALRVVFREPRAVAEVREGARRHAGTRKDAPVEELLKTALDGVYMAKSINPHAESARRTLDVLAGGPVPMKVPALAPPDVALGLRHPAPRNKAKKSMGSELDLITSMASQSAHGHSASHLDSPSLGRSATMPLSSKASLVTAAAAPSASSGGHSRKKGGQLEWRERWIFIKDGVLHLKKENSVGIPDIDHPNSPSRLTRRDT
ncbi:hypothetical protein GYMLUDRAFT_599350 [Collybiopsis luxurians FD-317 M1]|uniref:PH domain-containing protein n=1 Tax=Collybiopsis luxurians FD-317 M1 TaxID=944289 RepID=A0A0D0CEL7_9AGAR|nr:hypothetical protein GYMLUDRAFT_599350 [Collybiopsis luxurians FD-317 M1]